GNIDAYVEQLAVLVVIPEILVQDPQAAVEARISRRERVGANVGGESVLLLRPTVVGVSQRERRPELLGRLLLKLAIPGDRLPDVASAIEVREPVERAIVSGRQSQPL